MISDRLSVRGMKREGEGKEESEGGEEKRRLKSDEKDGETVEKKEDGRLGRKERKSQRGSHEFVVTHRREVCVGCQGAASLS